MYRVEDLQPDDCIAVAGTGILADVIKWATVSPVSHIAQVGHGTLIEAVARVSTAPLDKYCASGWVFRPSVPAQVKERAIAWSMSKIGQPYGLSALIEDGERTILHIPVAARLNPKGFVCSGMYELAHEAGGVPLTYAVLCTPADLVNSPLLVGQRPWLQLKARQ